MKILNFITALLTITLFLTALNPAFGQGKDNSNFRFEQPKGFGVQALNAGKNQAEGVVETVITNIITIFYTVGGLGVIIYFVWGSVDWILSGGDKEKIAGARKKMTNAIIGLVLLSLSYVIINIIGEVVGFNPLGDLQLRGLGTPN